MYVRGNDKRLKVEYDTLQKVKNNLLEGKHVRFLEWDEKEMGLESFVSSKFINFFQKNPGQICRSGTQFGWRTNSHPQ